MTLRLPICSLGRGREAGRNLDLVFLLRSTVQVPEAPAPILSMSVGCAMLCYIGHCSGATPADPSDGRGGAEGNGEPLQRGQWQISNLWTSPFHWESERPRRGWAG